MYLRCPTFPIGEAYEETSRENSRKEAGRLVGLNADGLPIRMSWRKLEDVLEQEVSTDRTLPICTGDYPRACCAKKRPLKPYSRRPALPNHPAING